MNSSMSDEGLKQIDFCTVAKSPEKFHRCFATSTGNLSKCSIYLCEYARGVRGAFTRRQ